MPRPALVSTTTSCPAAVNSATEAGVNPTLNSLFLISFGTPTRIFKSFFKAEPDLATLPGAHRSPCRSFRFQGNALYELALDGMLKLIVVGAGALSKMKTKRAAQPSDIKFVETLEEKIEGASCGEEEG